MEARDDLLLRLLHHLFPMRKEPDIGSEIPKTLFKPEFTPLEHLRLLVQHAVLILQRLTVHTHPALEIIHCFLCLQKLLAIGFKLRTLCLFLPNISFTTLLCTSNNLLSLEIHLSPDGRCRSFCSRNDRLGFGLHRVELGRSLDEFSFNLSKLLQLRELYRFFPQVISGLRQVLKQLRVRRQLHHYSCARCHPPNSGRKPNSSRLLLAPKLVPAYSFST